MEVKGESESQTCCEDRRSRSRSLHTWYSKYMTIGAAGVVNVVGVVSIAGILRIVSVLQ